MADPSEDEARPHAERKLSCVPDVYTWGAKQGDVRAGGARREIQRQPLNNGALDLTRSAIIEGKRHY